MSLPRVDGRMPGLGALVGPIWHVLVPAGTALAVGLWGISASGPWSDEVQTIDALKEGLTTHAWEAPLLPYYAVQYMWSGGGQFVDITWLRLLSVLATAVAAAAVALTATRLATPRAGLLAGLALACGPGVARYSQEARPYAVALALTATATWFLVIAMTHNGRRWWVSYGLLVAAATILLPITFAILPAHAVLIVSDPDWRPRLRSWLLVCVALVPIAIVEAWLAAQLGRMHEWLDRPSIAGSLGDIGLVTGAAAGGAAYAAALATLACLTRPGLRWLAGWLAALASIFLLSISVMSWWTPRTFIPLSGILCVAAAFAVARAGWPVIVVLTGLLVLLSAPALLADRQPGTRGIDTMQLAAVLDAHGQPGDTVVAGARWPYLGWAHRLFLDEDPRFTAAEQGSGDRWWELSGTPTCSDFVEWRVAGDVPLRLCR